ncbi:MAG: SGNH/GDSL hydrolase family protein [Actinobacteria bacterium]|nr:SGNH/GDSL hydrolase family protein [Actinomycetota bacterium]NCW43278.1 SGNH/GDSL hydrolase family protein [Actinomycetota bacterium]NCX16632.1 SGNH/GDSL hydrolase family protein [Actinomycetota bacterium]NCX39441.1 SGNH/GDSL hydrolase family protein [Actinomycetota bacterium]NCX52906.1 SGNH/GDSL hydrolase family protein [Actinomycetota bacterium]
MIYTRFIALGDSYTEGMSDEKLHGNYRGWADRVADGMAKAHPDFTYANLAVRGKLVRQVIDEQLEAALAQVTGPETLVSFHAGANDVIRPGYKPEIVLAQYADAVRRLAASGATILLFTVLERTGNTGRSAKMWEERFGGFNRNVRAVAQEVGAIIADANKAPAFSDKRFLAFDRLHLNALGHQRVADAVLEILGLPFNPGWRDPLPPAKPEPKILKVVVSVLWFITFALPWMWRRARGKSSGDGRSCKYPIAIGWPLNLD